VPPKTDIAVPRHAPHKQSKIRGAALNHGLPPAANESPQRIRDGASTKADLTVLEEAKPELAIATCHGIDQDALAASFARTPQLSCKVYNQASTPVPTIVSRHVRA
jgi:hypothetical protein